jgi:hypothetical protein
MKKIYRVLVMLFLSMHVLYAGGGTSQEHLVSVEPSPNAEDVSPTLTAVFTYDKNIVQTSVHKKTVKLKQTKPQKNNIEGTVVVQSDKSLAFMPSQPLEKGTYQIKVKPIKLLKDATVEVKPKNSWQKFIVWLCGLVYDDITECPLCRYVCDASNYIKTKPIHYIFEVKDDAPEVVSLDVNVTLVELSEHNSSTIKVTATYDDNTTEDVTQKATYTSDDSSVNADKGVITTGAEGSAVVTVTYAGKTSTVQVEVYEMIEGHLLPHEPDNPDDTLLGVDKNENGVRDEVERWIYKDMPTYHHPEIERVIGMQQAKAYQLNLSDPNNTKDIPITKVRKAINCWAYYIELKDIPFDEAFKAMQNYNARMQDNVFNTKERLQAYRLFNQNLGVRVFTSMPSSVTNCETNIDSMK